MKLGSCEPTPVSFPEAGFLALGGYLLDDPGVKSGSGGLTARRGPVAFGRHCLDQLVARHGLAVSAKTLAAASNALSFGAFVSPWVFLAFLDLAFLGLFDAAMTRLPNLGVSR
jgi:hypothetical protein